MNEKKESNGIDVIIDTLATEQKRHDTREFGFRALTDDDWDFIPDWYDWYEAIEPERKFLPNNGLGGFVVSTPKGTPIAILFLWETNSSTAIVAEMISNRNYKRDDKQNALTELTVFTTKMAELKGFEWAFGWGMENTIEHYKNAGYGVQGHASFEVSKKLK